MAELYWIHLPGQDLFKDGYVGFTSRSTAERFEEHLASSRCTKIKNRHLANAIKKYGDKLIVSTILRGSDDYCLVYEKVLRPKYGIGWNLAVGGDKPVLGRKEWQHPSSNKPMWAAAQDFYECYQAHNGKIGPVLLSRAFGTITKSDCLLGKFRGGWIPQEDSEWLSWSISQVEKFSGWKAGDGLLEVKVAELTPKLLAARALGSRGRPWTQESRDKLSKSKKGVTLSQDAIERGRKTRIGQKRTPEQKQAIKDRLARAPWTNATAIHANWARAQYLFDYISNGGTHAGALREFGLGRKAGTLSSIVDKIKAGWNPSEDAAYLSWLAEYKPTTKEAPNA